MTVSTVVDHNDYTGNGVTISFPYTFRIFTTDNLLVTVTDLNLTETVLTLDTDYSVTGAGGYSGGNVVLTSPLATGWKISIARELEPTQETDLRNQGKFFAEVHEDAFDKLTMLIQQAFSWLTTLNRRAVKVPEDGSWVAPRIADRKNKLFAWGDSGQPIAVLPPNSSASDVMIEFAKPTGAGLSGYSDAVNYPANTVGSKIQGMDSDLSKLSLTSPGVATSIATVLKKANDGSTITIACYGDSLTYGQDTSTTGGQPPINGATQGRSPNPYPEMLGVSLSTIGITATIRNRGFPGDTSADGIIRWASSDATDVAIIMYGTNDAIKTSALVSVDNFRKNIVKMIERETSKGTAVILMSPPNVAERIKNAQIAPYRAQMKYLADAYGLPFIDAAEQLETITNLWTDNIHLTTFAYNELGWHIASLFANREGSILTVGAGQLFHPTGHIGYGGSTSFKVVSGSKGANYLIELGAGQVYAIGVYCDEDVLPVIHSVNSQGTNSSISAYYSGAASSTSGVKTAGLAHQSSLGYRQKLTAQKLSKGYRTLYLLNNGTVPAYIEAIEFQSLSQPAMTLGFFAKSDALSGIHQPARISNTTNGWVAADVSRMLTADCQFCARVTLGTEAIGGIALMNGFQVVPNTFSDNVIMAIRSGAILGIREIINGVVGSDTPASGVFPATGTWTGEIEMEIVGTTCNVYVDGVLKVTKTGITVNRGYPAVYGQTSQRLTCHSALIKGYTKAIYE
ncbi:GDSL-type esterase/lipase family protein [Enterobacter kobei]|uniref:GDSL-type esterase/lipase family protein n=1 Tax=Enterobacter kobei TaxID=208224 RepID=UPI003966E15B